MPPGLYAGRCARATCKKSPTFEERDLLLAPRAGAVHAPTKRCYLDNRAKSLREWTDSELRASFLAKIGAGRRYLELVPRRTARRRAYYPSHPQTVKVDLEGVFCELRHEHPLGCPGFLHQTILFSYAYYTLEGKVSIRRVCLGLQQERPT